MCFELVDHEKVAVLYIVHVAVDEEALTSAKAEKQLAAFVDMYLVIGLTMLGVEKPEGLGFRGVFYRACAVFEKAFHF